ncbi:MAG: hypothetical protein ABW321_02715 [Polyangiales bacterium]
MRRACLITWLALCGQLAGCELIADFDRGKLDPPPPDASVTIRDGGQTPEEDAEVPN